MARKKKKGTVNIGRKLPKGSKRARQYEHIKESAIKSGKSTKRAKTIAAATTNKQVTKDKRKRKSKRSKRKRK